MSGERWQRLLSDRRIGRDDPVAADRLRTDFQRDYDRIVFSSAFRRLQDKTQVFPLSGIDYVRTRLTHSLEASCIGRTLGTLVGEQVIARHGLEGIQSADFGAIVAAACLAHDVGNPPFGHAGEDAIRLWFAESRLAMRLLEALEPAQQEELLRFEGNAQGFRVLTRLQSPDNRGGMQLTAAVLGAFTKYPRCALLSEPLTGVSGKKHGFFEADACRFGEVAAACGLSERIPGEAWQRHPLAFLVEAADDIAYRVIDFEDGFRLGLVEYATVRDLFGQLIGDLDEARLTAIAEPKRRVEYLRARAINAVATAVAEAFLEREAAIVEGVFDAELIEQIPQARALEAIYAIATRSIYRARPVLEIEAAGFEVLGGLLESFAGAAEEVATQGKGSARARVLADLIPAQFDALDRDPYRRLLGVTDFVAGMTDSYAVSLFKKVRGISLG